MYMGANAGEYSDRYCDDVPIGRTPSGRIKPVPYLAELDRWVGHWVAIKDGHVIAASETSADLTYQLRNLGSRGCGAVTEFVRPSREDAYIIGAG